MLQFVEIFLVLVGLCAFGIVLADMCMNSITQIKRLHIGRWENEDEWISAVTKRAYKWLHYTPTVRKTDNCRYLLWDVICGNYRNKTIQSWQTARLVLGINSINDEQSRYELEQWRKRTFTKEGMWKKSGNKIDFAMLGYAALKSGIEANAIKPAMDEIIRIIEENMCEDGMISYSQGKKSNIRFVDTLGMICPFLAIYGVKYNEKKYVKMAFEQIEKYKECGMLKNSNLPCHAYDVNSNLPLGVYGWGRGTAWYFLAMLDTWKELPDSQEKNIMKTWILEAAEEYLIYQQSDGGFFTILQSNCQYDSSVTAAMAYFFMNCWYIFGKEKYLASSSLCLNKIKSVTMKNGAVDCCQGDTHGIGSFSQVFDIMPFAQGLVLQTIFIRK